MSAPSGTLLKESVCLSISATQLSAYCTVTVSCPPSSFSCVIPFSVSPPTLFLSLRCCYCYPPPPSFDRRCPEPTGSRKPAAFSSRAAAIFDPVRNVAPSYRCNLPVRTQYRLHPLLPLLYPPHREDTVSDATRRLSFPPGSISSGCFGPATTILSSPSLLLSLL